MIDLRSDTVTRPSNGMRHAIAGAAVGDDVFADDLTVRRLETMIAERLEKEAAVFVTSGTQSNLVALLAHCGRGDEYLVGDMAHCYRWEGGGAAVLGSIQPQPIPMLADGLPDPSRIADAVKPDDPHYARTKILCVENTKDGVALSVDRMREATSVARDHGLRTHLDGARMWNAAISLGVSGAELTADFDTVSMCLSKGLGAPMGSVLSGPADLVAEARKWRKMLGGGLRQVGIVAAAGIYAVEHNIDRLADDHATAAALAVALGEIEGVEITSLATNMVFLTAPGDPTTLTDGMTEAGIAMVWSDAGAGRSSSRIVAHLDVDETVVPIVADALRRQVATG